MEYKELILPLAAGLIAQLLKFFIKSNGQQFKLARLASYSGMPSGHSAIVACLATIVGLTSGFNSPLFAVSAVLAVIVIRDALGIRRYLGQHGRTLNLLVKDLKTDEMLDEEYPKLLEKIGHTPLQVLAGSFIGFLVGLTGYLYF